MNIENLITTSAVIRCTTKEQVEYVTSEVNRERGVKFGFRPEHIASMLDILRHEGEVSIVFWNWGAGWLLHRYVDKNIHTILEFDEILTLENNTYSIF